MSVKDKLSELRKLRDEIFMAGGADGVKKQHENKKLTARERLNLLFDEGSFIEIGSLVKQRPTELDLDKVDAPSEGVLTGYGAIEGRAAYAFAQDLTVLGGAFGEMQGDKISKIIDMAIKTGSPVIGLFESHGMRLKEGIDALNGYKKVIEKLSEASGLIPVLSGIFGPCIASNAIIARNADFTISTDKAQAYMTSPVVLKAAFNQDSEGIGNAKSNALSGNFDNVVLSDTDCISRIKEILSYLPSNNLDPCPVYDNSDMINRLSQKLNEMTASESFDIPSMIWEISDKGSFTQVMDDYSDLVVCGFARMNGSTAGMIANLGDISLKAALKASRFINFCDSFSIPLITLVDSKGFEMSSKEENEGLISAATILASSFSGATTVKISVIVNNAFGSAFVAMTAGSDLILALPNAKISFMEPDAAVDILYSEKIAKSSDPISYRQELIEKFESTLASPYEAAKRGYVDDVVETDSLRPRLISALDILSTKREIRPSKKHPNFPL